MVQNPDGTVLFAEENAFTHHRRMRQQPSTGFVMLDPAIEATLEEYDQRGRYVIRAVVRDRVLRQTANGVYEVTLTE